jgi:hypothetical protein
MTVWSLAEVELAKNSPGAPLVETLPHINDEIDREIILNDHRRTEESPAATWCNMRWRKMTRRMGRPARCGIKPPITEHGLTERDSKWSHGAGQRECQTGRIAPHSTARMDCC